VHDAHVALEVRFVAEAAEANGARGFALVHGIVADAGAVRIERALADRAQELVVLAQNFVRRRFQRLDQHHLPCNVNTKLLLKICSHRKALIKAPQPRALKRI